MPYTYRHTSLWYGMTVRSYAKINLGLRLLRKRPDGFHDLETVFHRVELYDEIDFRQSRGTLTLTTDRGDLPTDSGNLCMRAAELIRRRARAGTGVAMALRKGIPVGAGLGGGSSDAATVLMVLKDLWSVPLRDEELTEMALSLGSDVPYFLHSGSAVASGRGERLEPIALDLPYWIVIVVPWLSVSTAWAYQNVRLQSRGPGSSLKAVLTNPSPDEKTLSAQLTNDFESLVLEAYPAIRNVKQQLLNLGASFALMSGSGSAVFALFADEQMARQAMGTFTTDRYTVSLTKPGFMPPVPHIVRN